jgi:hypothetical protein
LIENYEKIKINKVITKIAYELKKMKEIQVLGMQMLEDFPNI